MLVVVIPAYQGMWTAQTPVFFSQLLLKYAAMMLMYVYIYRYRYNYKYTHFILLITKRKKKTH